jgi:hypothetical protein
MAALTGLIEIRFAKIGDKPDVLRIAEGEHSRTIFSELDLHAEKMKVLFDRCLEKSRHECCLVATRAGKTVGFAYAVVGEYKYGKGDFLTTVHSISLDRSELGAISRIRTFLALLEALKRWSASRKSHTIVLNMAAALIFWENYCKNLWDRR